MLLKVTLIIWFYVFHNHTHFKGHSKEHNRVSTALKIQISYQENRQPLQISLQTFKISRNKDKSPLASGYNTTKRRVVPHQYKKLLSLKGAHNAVHCISSMTRPLIANYTG